MADQSYTTSITVDRTPDDVFDAIINPTAWWSDTIEGHADEIGARFAFETPGAHLWRFRVLELERPRKVVWRVLDDSSTDFVDDQTEWNNTEVRFEITTGGANATQIRFTHAGLVPELECYESCSRGWSGYIEVSLRDYITTGQGQPGVY
jgi:Activator of Hsp90 ATPase homolog 1-like protein